MTVHVFNDSHGFIMNLTVRKILSMAEDSREHIFINLNKRTLYKMEGIRYLAKKRKAYMQAVNELPPVDLVIFYPLDSIADWFLKFCRERFPAVPVYWVFWSYEYYQRKDLYRENLDEYSRQFERRHHKKMRFGWKDIREWIKRRMRIPYDNPELRLSSHQAVSKLFAFLPADFEEVQASMPTNKISFHQFSFLSLDAIVGRMEPGINLSAEIMIGHSAALSGNHAEIIERLATLNVNRKIFIPLEYGNLVYGEEIKSLARKKLTAASLQFLEHRLEMADYYQRLSFIGFAIFNFRWQEGLGNILFLIWNGAKVFVREDSTVYRQFRDWGIRLYSLEKELTIMELSSLLPSELALQNRRRLEELFSEEKIREYWAPLVQIPSKPA